jgi:hypothetical protein
MNKIPIYCSISFLVEFYKDLNRLKKSDRQNDENDLLIVLAFESLLKKADLYVSRLNIKEVLDETSSDFSPRLKDLIRQKTNADSEKYPKTTSSLDNFRNTVLTQPHAIFILDAETESQLEKCKDLEAKFGVICFKHANWKEKADFLLNWAMFAIVKGSTNKFKDWKEIAKFQHPCNAIIFADNYILTDEKDITTNLLPILDSLLPLNKLEIPFQITFLVNDVKLEGNKLGFRYTTLLTQIQELRKEMSFDISILFVEEKSDNHDRNIITNYLWLHSGHSFAYFKEQKGKIITNENTNLFISPITYQAKDYQNYYANSKVGKISSNSIFDAVRVLLKQAKEIKIKYSEPKPPKNNRLL